MRRASAHSTRARAALARLPEVDPAIAALSLWCSYRDGSGPTRTEGETILIGPDFPDLPISEQTGLISHHVLHVALRHSARRASAAARYGPGFQPRLYDLACDALVNEMLLQGGHALPRPAVRAAEVIQLLPPEQRPTDVLAEWDCARLYSVLADQPAAGAEAIQHYAEQQGFAPDLEPSAPEGAEEDVWEGRMEQALSAGRQAGSGIGTRLGRFADLPRSTVPWEVKLRRLLAKALSPQALLSHRRPARAWLARDALARRTGGPQPVFEPALTRDQRRPRLVVALDTSSSITDSTLNLFAAEALSIQRRMGAESHLLGFDTEVHTRATPMGRKDLGGLSVARDGGTDFGPVLAEADALTPSMIVVLTDLDAPTGVAARAPVLWAVPAPPPRPPSIGTVLVMADEPRP